MGVADERLGRSDPDPDEYSDAELNAALLRHLPAFVRELGCIGESIPDGAWRSVDGRLVVFFDGSWRFDGSHGQLTALFTVGRRLELDRALQSTARDMAWPEEDKDEVGYGDEEEEPDARPVMTLPPVDPARLLIRLDVLLRRNGVKLYRRGGRLVRRALVHDVVGDARRAGTPTLVPVEDNWLLEQFREVARFRCRDGEILLSPGLQLARRYLAWAVRRWPEVPAEHSRSVLVGRCPS